MQYVIWLLFLSQGGACQLANQEPHIYVDRNKTVKEMTPPPSDRKQTVAKIYVFYEDKKIPIIKPAGFN